MHPTTAEAGDLTGGIESLDRLPVLPNARESRSVWMPPNVFRVRTCSLTPISGPASGSRMMGEAVRRSGRRGSGANSGYLAPVRLWSTGWRSVDPGPGSGHGLPPIQQRLVGELIHLVDKFVEVVRHDEVRAAGLERPDRSGAPLLNTRSLTMAARSRLVMSGFCSEPDSANSFSMIFWVRMNQLWS